MLHSNVDYDYFTYSYNAPPVHQQNYYMVPPPLSSIQVLGELTLSDRHHTTPQNKRRRRSVGSGTGKTGIIHKLRDTCNQVGEQERPKASNLPIEIFMSGLGYARDGDPTTGYTGPKTTTNNNSSDSEDSDKPKPNPFSPECSIPLPIQLGDEYGYYGPTAIWKRNERERHRVRCVNEGYEKLRQHLPLVDRDKRLSKVETLRLAIRYIQHLQLLLADPNHDERGHS